MRNHPNTSFIEKAINSKIRSTTVLLGALLAAMPVSLLAADGDGAWYEFETANNSLPTARHEAGGLAIGNNIYILGGRATRPLQRLNTVTNTWDMSVAAPMEMHHFQPVTWGGKIYVVGAFTCCYPNEVNITKIQIFDPATQTWSEGDEMPVARQRGSAGTVVYNNKIYLVGGNTNGHNGGAVPWFDEYDPATGVWRTLDDAPNSRDHFAAVIVGNKLVAAGGRQTKQPYSQANTEAAVDVYNFQTGQWMTGFQNIPTPRAGVAAVKYDDEVIVIGGETSQTQAHNQVEALNVNTGLWRTLPALITGRHGHAAGVVGDDLYAISGNTVAGGGAETTTTESINLASVAGSVNDQDPDNDGLTTSEETNTYGTDPNKKDTDGDNLSDGDELLTHDTDPLKVDTDSDGLNDGVEVNQYNTDPTKSDTDSDGLGDAAEVNNYHTDPLKSDTDGDGLSDELEVEQHGTSPLKQDTDDDGLADNVELQQTNTDPNDADSDDDSLSDSQEIDLGTDPMRSDSDNDGDADASEVANGTDPLDADDHSEQTGTPTDPGTGTDPETDPETGSGTDPDTDPEKGKSGSSGGGAAWFMIGLLLFSARLRRKQQ